MSDFDREVERNVASLADAVEFRRASQSWLLEANRRKYAYNFSWLGRPIFQVPQDLQAAHEIIWQVQPDLIIETGIARGGSLVFNASMLAMIDLCEATRAGGSYRLGDSKRRVVGIDIDIRSHNREAIEQHPLAALIEMVAGSSTDPSVIDHVGRIAESHERVMVCLDSNHTHEHVLNELNAYAPMVTPGSYCIVYDTGIEDLPAGFCSDRPWDKGDNPKTAVWAFLAKHTAFSVDKSWESKLGITSAPDGFLVRTE